MARRNTAAVAQQRPVTSEVERKTTADKNRQAAEDRLLEKINAYLRDLGLTELKSRGVEEDGFLLLDVVTHYPCFNYVIVQFNAIGPSGAKKLDDGTIVPIPYFMKFLMYGAQRKGCILLVVANQTDFVFARQHRAPGLAAMGDSWLNEAPRGNPLPPNIETMLEGKIARSGLELDEAAKRTLAKPAEGDSVTSHPIGLLGRELQPLIRHGEVVVRGLYRLNDDVGILEDSGMSAAANDFWCLDIDVPPQALKTIRGSRQVGIRSYPVDMVLMQSEKLDIRDNHTLTAIQLFLQCKYRSDPKFLLQLLQGRVAAVS